MNFKKLENSIKKSTFLVGKRCNIFVTFFSLKGKKWGFTDQKCDIVSRK